MQLFFMNTFNLIINQPTISLKLLNSVCLNLNDYKMKMEVKISNFHISMNNPYS